MNLLPIATEELLFTNEIEDDRTNTSLSLDDYDWMNYVLKTRFRTNKQGILKVSFEYFGMTISTMIVDQIIVIDNKEQQFHYEYEYNSNIFAKHIKDFLLKHIEQWEPTNTYAFNGEEFVIKFYNEVLEKGIIKTNSSNKS